MCFIIYVSYHAYVFFKHVREDPYGDGRVDAWTSAILLSSSSILSVERFIRLIGHVIMAKPARDMYCSRKPTSV